jgi:hypothetical protein
MAGELRSTVICNRLFGWKGVFELSRCDEASEQDLISIIPQILPTLNSATSPPVHLLRPFPLPNPPPKTLRLVDVTYHFRWYHMHARTSQECDEGNPFTPTTDPSKPRAPPSACSCQPHWRMAN